MTEMKVQSVPLADLKNYPNNPRKGNVDVIADSLATYGQYKPITVNKRTNEILAGNHTYRAAKQLEWETIDVVFVDVDETTAAKIVAIDNRSTDVSEYDNEALKELLESLPDLDGSGYDDSDLDDLRALLEEANTPTVAQHFEELKKGEQGQSNTAFTPNLMEYAERYAEKSSRMVVLDYPNDTYVWVIEKLVEYRKVNDISSNTAAIVDILEGLFGEKAPE